MAVVIGLLLKSQSLFYWKPLCNENKKCKECKKCRHNPYFTGNLFATGKEKFGFRADKQSQSLFCWKPLCNSSSDKLLTQIKKVTILILLETSLQLDIDKLIDFKSNLSQSLFYWKPLCNTNNRRWRTGRNVVTILILLETSLQPQDTFTNEFDTFRHNPYFTGNLFATEETGLVGDWTPSHNPYFTGNLFATSSF